MKEGFRFWVMGFGIDGTFHLPEPKTQNPKPLSNSQLYNTPAMKHAAIFVMLFAGTLLGQNDPRLETVSNDLKAIGRVASLSRNLTETRQVMEAIVDENIENFREPAGDGTYRWANYQREEAGRIKDERTVDRIHTEEKLTTVTISGSRAYRVLVSVPRKKGFIAENNPVFIRNIVAEWTGFDGARHQQDIPVNAWVKPGDSHGVPLPEIGKNVKAILNLGAENSEKKAVAEVALMQARLVDDPTSPNFPVVRRLLGIKALLDRDSIRRSDLKNAVDEALLALPGELQKRFSEDEALAEQRMAMARSGQLTGTIGFGDATPDVISKLDEINNLLSGNFSEQSLAREKLQALIELLRAP